MTITFWVVKVQAGCSCKQQNSMNALSYFSKKESPPEDFRHLLCTKHPLREPPLSTHYRSLSGLSFEAKFGERFLVLWGPSDLRRHDFCTVEDVNILLSSVCGVSYRIKLGGCALSVQGVRYFAATCLSHTCCCTRVWCLFKLQWMWMWREHLGHSVFAGVETVRRLQFNQKVEFICASHGLAARRPRPSRRFTRRRLLDEFCAYDPMVAPRNGYQPAPAYLQASSTRRFGKGIWVTSGDMQRPSYFESDRYR